MPDLQGNLTSTRDIPKIDSKVRTPSPAPSEPAFKTANPELNQPHQGPPKPPRDPSRLSMLDLHKSHHEGGRLSSRDIAGKEVFRLALVFLPSIGLAQKARFLARAFGQKARLGWACANF